MKKSVNTNPWMFLCFILAILFGLSIYLGLSGWYFKNTNSYKTDLRIGEKINLNIDNNQSQASALNIEGAFLNEDFIPQTISITNVSDKNLYLRVKVYLVSKDGYSIEIGLKSNEIWDYSDGYYYIKTPLTVKETVTLTSAIKISDFDMLTNKKYVISIVCESLSENQNVLELWGRRYDK